MGDSVNSQPKRLACPSQLVAASLFGNIVKILLPCAGSLQFSKKQFMLKIDASNFCRLSGSEILSLTGGSSNLTKDLSVLN